MDKQYKTNITQNHPFYLVDSSPLVAFLGALFIIFGGVMYMHLYKNGLFLIGLFTILYVIYCWWRDIVREGSFEGQHTKIVQHGLRMGMILFIISEIMFFYSSLSPAPTISGVWPPIGIEILNPWEIPLLNTILLLSSGATVTWAHHSIVASARKKSFLGLFFSYTFLNVVKYFYWKIKKKTCLL